MVHGSGGRADPTMVTPIGSSSRERSGDRRVGGTVMGQLAQGSQDAALAGMAAVVLDDYRASLASSADLNRVCSCCAILTASVGDVS